MATDNLGLGVLIQMLGGNEESAKLFSDCIGKTISELRLGEDDALHFVFADGSKMKLADEGQSCCEVRYMRTDDDLPYYVDSQLVGAEIRDGSGVSSEYGDEHEVQFLLINTSKGAFTMSSHNEHNGYYGGFYVVASKEES